MLENNYDLIVIGAGSGGVRSARLAAILGKKVALIEESKIGGTCVNRGCVPKKLMLYASEYSSAIEHSLAYGWRISGDIHFDWDAFMQAKAQELSRLESIYLANLEKAGVILFRDKAKFISEHEVELSSGDILRGENIIVAVGARPNLPSDIIGIEHVATTDDILELPNKINSLIVYGGGYTAVEFANIFHGLGVKVSLVYHGDLILRGFDRDLRSRLSRAMLDKGINIIYNSKIKQISKSADDKKISLDNGEILSADEVLFAVGRSPNTEKLNLQAAGVQLGDSGEIIVDEYLASNKPHIYAVGDVKGQLQLAPVAIDEAVCLIKTLYEKIPTKPDYEYIATAVFSQPELATVGVTEEEAARIYDILDVYNIDFRPMKHAITGANSRIFMKILVDGITDRVVGAHLLGANSAELIQILAIALKAGVKKADFDRTMAVHPTSSEELVLAYNPSYTYKHGLRIVR